MSTPKWPMKAFLIRNINWIAFFCALVAFCWSYYSTHDLNRSLMLIAKVILPPFFVYKYWIQKTSLVKNSGLSQDEFLLQTAGGPDGLLKIARRLRIFGWFCVLTPLIVVGACWNDPVQTGVFAGVIIGFVSIPTGLGCLWIAKNHRAVAEKSRPK